MVVLLSGDGVEIVVMLVMWRLGWRCHEVVVVDV